jgi:hypothetical protein
MASPTPSAKLLILSLSNSHGDKLSDDLRTVNRRVGGDAVHFLLKNSFAYKVLVAIDAPLAKSMPMPTCARHA